MALCSKPCCNAEARKEIREAREAEFAAFLAEREATKKATIATDPAALVLDRAQSQEWANIHDFSYAHAVALAESRVRTEAEQRLNRMAEEMYRR